MFAEEDNCLLLSAGLSHFTPQPLLSPHYPIKKKKEAATLLHSEIVLNSQYTGAEVKRQC